SPSEIDSLCRASRERVAFVPSLSGLGSPHYKPVKTALFGLTRATARADLVRGLIEGIAFLVKDNYETMKRERGQVPRVVTAGGGVARSSWLLQFQADLLQLPIVRAGMLETTSRGAAILAARAGGLWTDRELPTAREDGTERFTPRRSRREVQSRYDE